MASRSQRLRLLDIQTQMDAIEQAMVGRTDADLTANWLLGNAVERGFEIISEASRHLDPVLLAQHPDVPWRRVADIGNWLRHAYEKVEASLLTAIIRDQFPALRRAVTAMLASLPQD